MTCQWIDVDQYNEVIATYDRLIATYEHMIPTCVDGPPHLIEVHVAGSRTSLARAVRSRCHAVAVGSRG